MSASVLILASLYDLGTDDVSLALTRAGVSFVRLNREQLASHKLVLEPTTPSLHISGPAGTHVIAENLLGVLFRQPVFYRNTPAVPLTAEQQLERSQWHAFLRGLTVFNGARWMNHPWRTFAAESKPYQLAVARDCGFRIPQTLVSNDEGAIAKAFPARAAVKSVDTVLIREGDQTLFTFTQFVETSEFNTMDLRDAPVLAQKWLEPKLDVRVTMVGDRAFAVKIESDEGGLAGDWRTAPEGALRYTDYKLPADIESMCLALMEELGLAFGAIDLVETNEGTYFMEINPTGEWSWLSAEDRPIARAIADWLADSTEATVG